MSPLFTDRNKGSQIERKRWGSVQYWMNLAKTNPASEFLFVVRHMGRPGYWFWFDCCYWENVSGRRSSLFDTNLHYSTSNLPPSPITTGCRYQEKVIWSLSCIFFFPNFQPSGLVSSLSVSACASVLITQVPGCLHVLPDVTHSDGGTDWASATCASTPSLLLPPLFPPECAVYIDTHCLCGTAIYTFQGQTRRN